MTANLTTLVSFNDTDGADPAGSLIADANGDLFGTTSGGGANGDGTVFEIVKTAGGYASTPATLISFNGTNGVSPQASLIADANGDLFGTTPEGGANDDGTAFEIAKTAVGYASTPTTLVSLSEDAFSEAGLITDANGDLFGTTTGIDPTTFSTLTNGAVFEVLKTASGYASTPNTLVSFNGTNGETPFGSLIADSNGDLFGTTDGGGANDFGTVFEIVMTAGGYASAPTTLVSFNDEDGVSPKSTLIADSDGDLFGTTVGDGFSVDGTVFEIAKTAGGYASTPTTLVSFDNDDGSPNGGLIVDANGDLFGTTENGGATDVGTVFEIAAGASTPTILVSFNGTNGETPVGGLSVDANGDLFGTTDSGGANDKGTVFEITDSGFVPAPPPPPPPTITADLLWQNTSGQASIWDMDGNSLVGGGPVSPDPGPSWRAVGTGDFFGSGSSDILWQNTTSGQASIWQMDGNILIGGGAVSPNPGPNWRAVGTGDFNGAGTSGILLQNTSSGQVSIWEIGQTGGVVPDIIGGGAVTPNPGPAWKAIGTGDFNKDGDADILFQNTSTGQVSIWEMNGNTLKGGGAVSPDPGPAWQAIGTGDFNHDGFSDDILFQNTSTGQVSVWEMNGNQLIGGGPVSANPGLSWHAIGSGDGGSDILFQNISGQASIWEMNGNTIAGGGPVSPNPGTSWRAVGLS
jgi:uncharacterized repeat protein (TIGR03803 family)